MIELRGLQRVFRVGDQEVHALRDVDLAVAPGEYVSIMGPSGSGKSTLLNIIGLLDLPTAGHFAIDGNDVTGLDEEERAALRLRKIGFVFQFFHLVPRLTAAQNVELPLMLAGIAPAARRAKVATQLEAFGLSTRAEHRPDQLSGGQRQRVAIARATITGPEVVLADEPTGNLDRASGNDVVAVLEELHERGIALIVVTHDPDLGRRAHRHIRMDDGRIVADDAEGP